MLIVNINQERDVALVKVGSKYREITATVVVVAMLLWSIPASAAAKRLPHGLGARLEPASITRIRSFEVVAVPASVNLKSYAVTPGDQGQVGSCVAWATGYTLMGWYAKKDGRTGSPYAPMYVYSQINGGGDNGAVPSAAYKILAKQGVASQAVYTQGNYDWVTKPTAAEAADAAGHKSSGWQWITSGNFGGGVAVRLAFEQALASGHPATLSMEVFEPFFNLDSKHSVLKLADIQDAVDEGGHEVTAVGYNSTGLVIENSWGTGWGNKGFATLAWDFVEAYVADGAIIDGFAPLPAPSVKSAAPAILPTSGGKLIVMGNGFATADLTAAVMGPNGKSKLVKVISNSTNLVVLAMPSESAGTSQLTITTPFGAVIATVIYGKS
jgi:hypothetical protein